MKPSLMALYERLPTSGFVLAALEAIRPTSRVFMPMPPLKGLATADTALLIAQAELGQLLFVSNMG